MPRFGIKSLLVFVLYTSVFCWWGSRFAQPPLFIGKSWIHARTPDLVQLDKEAVAQATWNDLVQQGIVERETEAKILPLIRAVEIRWTSDGKFDGPVGGHIWYTYRTAEGEFALTSIRCETHDKGLTHSIVESYARSVLKICNQQVTGSASLLRVGEVATFPRTSPKKLTLLFIFWLLGLGIMLLVARHRARRTA